MTDKPNPAQPGPDQPKPEEETEMQALEDRPTAPPPPASKSAARVPLNTRILAEHDDELRAYQAEHGATRQAVVDQMVAEYLERRGRLPESRKP